MRAVTSAMTGCTLMSTTLEAQALARKRLRVQFTRVNLGPSGDHGRRRTPRGRLCDDGLARHQRDAPGERTHAPQRPERDREDGLPAELDRPRAGPRRHAIAWAGDQR